MKILAAASPGEVRIAAWGPAGLVDAAIWRPGSPDGVGDLHRARVTKRVPAMAGAFLVMADGDGFLPDTAGADGLSEGDVVAVRIVRAAQGGKGPRLVRADTDPGAGPPALLARGPSPIQRLAELHQDAEIIADDPALAAVLRPTLGPRLRQAPAFDDDVESAFASLADPHAELPGGARMHVTATPALTAVDIDLASATAERAAKSSAQRAANRAVLPALAAQIRLRNLSGAIVVDFGGMAAKRRVALAPELAAALAADPLHPRLLGFTALGMAEILRPRIHPPLAELLSGPLAIGLAALRAAAAEIAATPARRLALHAASAVIAALRADAVGLADFARRAGRDIVLVEHRVTPRPAWTIEDQHG